MFSNDFMLKVIIWLTNQPFALPFFRVITVEGPTQQFGELVTTGGWNAWVLTPIGIMNSIGTEGINPDYSLGNLQVFSIMGALGVIAITLIAVAISELVRLKKKQKISKPFTKLILILFPICGMLYGQVIVLIASGLLLTAWIFLEIVLFDAEAVSNYAEERNLITIYHEEKKFEKEVNKEGKLIGNIDLVTVKKRQEQSILDQNERANQNSSSMLPKGSSKWKIKYEILNEKKAQLVALDEKLQATVSVLNLNEKYEEIWSYNRLVKAINEITEQLGLGDEEKVSEFDMTRNSRISEEELAKIKKTKKYSAWEKEYKALGTEKDSFSNNLANLKESKKLKIVEKLNSKIKKLNELGNKIGLSQDFDLDFISIDDTFLGTGSDITKTTDFGDEIKPMPSMTNFPLEESGGQEVFQSPMVGDVEAEASEIFAELNQVEKTSSSEVEDIQAFANLIATPPTIKQTQTYTPHVETKIHNADPYVEQRLKLAIDMNVAELMPASSPLIDTDITGIYQDLNYEQKDYSYLLDGDVKNEATPEATPAAFDFTTFTPSLETPIVQPEPEVKLSKEEFDEHLKARLEVAINMDLDQLPTTEQSVNADREIIYNDINFQQPDLLASSTIETTLTSSVEKPTTASPFGFTIPNFSEASPEPVLAPTPLSAPEVSENIAVPFQMASLNISEPVLAPTSFSTEVSDQDIVKVINERTNFLDSKISQIDVKMVKLETVVEQINVKLEKVSESVEEIKNSTSPKTLIATLTKKHAYNKTETNN
ncbi:hypothetical protein SCLARK_00296 [Spiroplasma clarkii]|nr:hypothetical protein SCLARK_00296 [Spiroplasma clarkii]